MKAHGLRQRLFLQERSATVTRASERNPDDSPDHQPRGRGLKPTPSTAHPPLPPTRFGRGFRYTRPLRRTLAALRCSWAVPGGRFRGKAPGRSARGRRTSSGRSANSRRGSSRSARGSSADRGGLARRRAARPRERACPSGWCRVTCRPWSRWPRPAMDGGDAVARPSHCRRSAGCKSRSHGFDSRRRLRRPPGTARNRNRRACP